MTKNFLKEYTAQKNQELKEAKLRMKEICSILAGIGITRAEADYDGCGDSGAIEDIRFYSNKEEYKGEVPTHSFDSIFSYPNIKNNKISMKEAIEEILCLFLPDGWEINDGSYGCCTLDVRRKKLTVDHHQRFTDETYSQEEFRL